MRKRAFTGSWIVAAMWVAGCDSLPSADGARSVTCLAPEDSDAMVNELLALVNAARERHGSFPLVLSRELSNMAGDWACTMAQEDFFGHLHPNGETFADRWERSQFGVCSFGGENLAVNFHTPEEVFARWMASHDGHREEILQDQYIETGIAIRTDGLNVYWVEQFMGGGCDVGPPVDQRQPDITGGLHPMPLPVQSPSVVEPLTADPLDEPE